MRWSGLTDSETKPHVSLSLFNIFFLIAILLTSILAASDKPTPAPSPDHSRYRIGDTKDEPNPYGEIKTPSKWEQFLSFAAGIALLITGHPASLDYQGDGVRVHSSRR